MSTLTTSNVYGFGRQEKIMLNIQIRFVIAGQEVSLGSFAEAVVREGRQSIRQEISRTLRPPTKTPRFTEKLYSKLPPQAVSVREAARRTTRRKQPRAISNITARPRRELQRRIHRRVSLASHGWPSFSMYRCCRTNKPNLVS